MQTQLVHGLLADLLQVVRFLCVYENHYSKMFAFLGNSYNAALQQADSQVITSHLLSTGPNSKGAFHVYGTP